MKDPHALEQAIIAMLARLPVPIEIALPKEDLDGSWFSWRCLEGNGKAVSLDGALEQALCFLLYRVDSTVLLDIRWLDWYPHK